MRKLIAMILVLVSVFALAAPAMAAKRGVFWHSIEIDDPHDGIAPCLYKKMKATSSNVVKNLQDTGLTYVDVKFNTKNPDWVSARAHTTAGKWTGYMLVHYLNLSSLNKQSLRGALFSAYDLKRDDSGQAISNLTMCLKELGYLTSITDTFKPGVANAVTKFQRDNKLTNDGIVGENTKDMLLKKCGYAE